MKTTTTSLGLSAAVLVATLAFGFRPAPTPAPVFGGSEPFLGQVILFGGNFAPRGWAKCEGQLLSIAQNQALFSILGTTFGGDGETTFGLPDLRGRAPIGVGNGPGLTPTQLGAKAGAETATLSVSNMPSHSHQLMGQMEGGGSGQPTGRVPASTTAHRIYGPMANVPMSGDAIANTGGGQAVSIRNPTLGMTYIIALTGLFPSRS